MKKLTLAAIVGLGLMSGSALAASAWTGGDDQPTNPLSCDATPAAAVAKPYDGGVPTNPPDRKGKKITVVDVPKLIGIGYFNATSKGIADAAKVDAFLVPASARHSYGAEMHAAVGVLRRLQEL